MIGSPALRVPANDAEAGRFTRHLEAEVSRCLLIQYRVGLLFATIEGMAEITADSGPLTRARVLGDLVRAWRPLLGPGDALFHTAADDFTLICSHLTGPMPAMNLADAIHDVTAGYVVVPFPGRRLSLSVTVAFIGG